MSGRVITRKKLALYAALLGRNSLAARHLALYDSMVKMGSRPVIRIHNNDFTVKEGKDVL